jgi:hypothetical protein
MNTAATEVEQVSTLRKRAGTAESLGGQSVASEKSQNGKDSKPSKRGRQFRAGNVVFFFLIGKQNFKNQLNIIFKTDWNNVM